MNKAILQLTLYLVALISILAEPDFILPVGAIWLFITILSKAMKKPVATFKIKKK